MSTVDDLISHLRELIITDRISKASDKGPIANRKTVVDDATKVPSIKGMAAPGNVAGPGRPKAGSLESAARPKKVSEVVKNTKKPAGNKITGSRSVQTVDEFASTVQATKTNSGKEVMYVSKKDHPKAPKGTIGSTPNSWKVPAGIGRALQAKEEGGERRQPTTPIEAKGFDSKPKAREIVIAHLSEGTIASKTATSMNGNVTDTFKVVIQGNGSGLLKPDITEFRFKARETTRNKPREDDTSKWNYNPEQEVWERVVERSISVHSPRLIGAGAGTIQPGKAPQREVAGHLVSQLHDVGSVPVTVLRTVDGKVSSIQEWKEDVVSISALQETVPEATRDIDVLKSVVPKERHKHLEQQVMDMAVHDIITNANDRHAFNFIVNAKTGDIHLVDHGLSFGVSLHGHRNYFLHDCLPKQKPIKMSETLQARLRNLTVSDYKRAQPGLEEWEAGQSFLRNRYCLWLQENHGELDRQKFLPVVCDHKGKNQSPGDMSPWSFAGGEFEQVQEFIKRKEQKLLPHDLFEKWAKAYLEQASSDKNHPDHNDAKHLSEVGVFVEAGYVGFAGSSEKYRANNHHREYEASIDASFDIPKNIATYTKEYKADIHDAVSVVPTGD